MKEEITREAYILHTLLTQIRLDVEHNVIMGTLGQTFSITTKKQSA